jgi:hypothetical protein
MIDKVLGLSLGMLSALAWLWRRVDKLAKKGLLGAIVFVVHTFRFLVGAQ